MNPIVQIQNADRALLPAPALSLDSWEDFFWEDDVLANGCAHPDQIPTQYLDPNLRPEIKPKDEKGHP